ncbi:hypothetical protein ACG2LH_16045 [Zhouia sp. PK063]|uniref:hypothetical protein n=1 Tax=Zhouia sp. PK063 TaxID=3373602 RepID=UPI00379318C6
MKKLSVMLITVILNLPLYYSCTPKSMASEDAVYQNQRADGDEDGEILPPEEGEDPNNPDNPDGTIGN